MFMLILLRNITCFLSPVWQKLEEENREFFKAYHLRLKVKEQITLFNQLLERQVELMHISAGVASTPISNGSHIPCKKFSPQDFGYLKTTTYMAIIVFWMI